MNKQLTVAFSMAILLTVTVVASIDLNQTADAVKSKGTSLTEVGSSKVCGDRLCSEVSESDKAKHGEDKGKMKEKHLQMLEKMKSMNKMEMIDSMKSMMSEHRDMKIEKMSQMDGPELLKHIEKMLDKMSKDSHSDMDDTRHDEFLYNETLNPRQIDYPNTLGFSDLHIHAIRHLDVEKSHGTADHLLKTVVHHHCKVYDDMTASCLLFPTGMGDQDKPYGMEYIITSEQFEELSDDEKKYWHYHLTELPRAQAIFADLTDEELIPLRPILDETYGKVFYFWDTDDKYPIGEPTVLVIQDLPE